MILNNSQKGNWGIGECISYFSRVGFNLLAPVADALLDYDLMTEKDMVMRSVQVKATEQMNKTKTGYRVSLGKKYRKAGGKVERRRINKKSVFWIFVATPDANYCIPTRIWKVVPDAIEFTPNGIYQKYKVSR